jgi:hypothetical protein
MICFDHATLLPWNVISYLEERVCSYVGGAPLLGINYAIERDSKGETRDQLQDRFENRKDQWGRGQASIEFTLRDNPYLVSSQEL